MQDQAPSRTAMATAFIRALHLYVDDPPPLVDDWPAFELLPTYQQRFIRRLAALASPWRQLYRLRRDGLTAMRAQVLVRSRYAEDALQQARDEGVNRYVILAAGLDTFALRQGTPRIEVLEIDHPATQRWKRNLLESRRLALPSELSFAPVDFERDELRACWTGNSGPDFISWLGVTYYLSADAIRATLSTLADCARPGSHLVLDYWREPPPYDPSSWLLLGTRIAVAGQREPMRTFMNQREAEALAQDAGWQVLEHLDHRQQNGRYLTARSDGLRVPGFARLLHLALPRGDV